MKDVTTRADEMRDEDSAIDLARGVGSDQPAAVGDSITIRTGFGRIKATLLEIADPPLAGMELLPNIADMLLALTDSPEKASKRRALAVKLRLRNLDSGPFDRNTAVIPVQIEWLVGSDGEQVGGAQIKSSPLYAWAQVPEPGQPSSTGWVGFHLQTGVEPEALILSFGSGAARWQLVRRLPSPEPRSEDVSRGALLEKIKKGADLWNAWRRTRPHYEIDLAGADFRGFDLSEFDLSRVNLRGTQLSQAKLARTRFSGAFLRGAGFHDCDEFTGCDFSVADLRGASFARARISHAIFRKAILSEAHFVDCRSRVTDFSGATMDSLTAFHSQFWDCKLEGVHFDGSDLTESMLFDSNFSQSRWKKVKLLGTTLRNAKLRGSIFSESELQNADFSGADLSGATIEKCDLSEVSLVGANLDACTLSDLRVYGVCAWDIKGIPKSQSDFTITRHHEADLVVDDLELAQFMYLITSNEKVKNAIETITSRAVLILGRFTEDRLLVLRALRNKLRSMGLLPILFDFERPSSKDTTGVVETIARMSRFIVADLTDPSSVPHELATVVPFLRTIPVQPLRLVGSTGYGMVDNLKAYPWFLDVHEYKDPESLIERIPEIAERAEQMARKFQPR